MITKTLVILAALAALITAAPAHADTDVDFLRDLMDSNVPFETGPLGYGPAAIQRAHLICNQLAQGARSGELANQVAAGTGMDQFHAVTFVRTSVFHYCPELEAR